MFYFAFEDIVKNNAGISVEETVLTENSEPFVHGHDFYELFFVTEGVVIETVNGQIRHMAVGDMAVAGPGDTHSFRKGCYCTTARFVNIAFGSLQLFASQEVAAEVESRRRGFLTPAEQSFLLYQAGQLRWVDKEDAAAVASISRLLVQTALMLLQKNSLLGGEHPPAWLERCVALISQTENLAGGIQRMVALAGVTQEHLTRTIRQYYHTTPSRIVNQLRMEQARRLLRENDEPVTTIALRCGYNSESYFNRVFRATYNDTPSKYRQRCRCQMAGAAVIIYQNKE